MTIAPNCPAVAFSAQGRARSHAGREMNQITKGKVC